MKNKQQVIDFLTHIKGSSILQVGTLNQLSKFSEVDGKDGIYLCGGVKEKISVRCKDEHIGLKKYCFVDIDIRNDYYLKHQKVITQEELRTISAEIVARIELKGYNDYCALVDSGNGLHIYWTGKERQFDREVYSNGVKQLQSIINHIISDLGYVCDPACTNLARLSRLPGTINLRKKDIKEIKYDLGPIEAEILWFEPKDSETFDSLELFADLYKDQHEKEKKALVEAKRFIKDNHKKKDGEDIRQEINSIPVGDIAEYVRGVKQMADDGEVITLKEPHKNMGAYVYKPFNIVYNQGSSIVKTDRKTFTPFELVCFELMDGDRPNTLRWFKEKYGIEDNKKQTKKPIVHEKLFKKIGYIYPGEDMNKAFGCIVSGELVTIAAATNKGKTSFGLNILKSNKSQKVGLINMEFDISDTFRFQYLRSKGYKDNELKSVGTSINPTTPEFEGEIQAYIDKRMSEIDIHTLPQNTELETVLDKIYELGKQGYSMIMIDSLSSIKGGNNNEGQELIAKELRNFCTETGITILLIHHFNKGGKVESGSQKVSDLSNITILIHYAEDAIGNQYRAFVLKKDKAHSKIIVFHGTLEIGGNYKEVDHGLQDPSSFIF